MWTPLPSARSDEAFSTNDNPLALALRKLLARREGTREAMVPAVDLGVAAAAASSSAWPQWRSRRCCWSTRGAREGSYFEDSDGAFRVFGVLATAFAVLIGSVVFL